MFRGPQGGLRTARAMDPRPILASAALDEPRASIDRSVRTCLAADAAAHAQLRDAIAEATRLVPDTHRQLARAGGRRDDRRIDDRGRRQRAGSARRTVAGRGAEGETRDPEQSEAQHGDREDPATRVWRGCGSVVAGPEQHRVGARVAGRPSVTVSRSTPRRPSISPSFGVPRSRIT